MDCDTFINRYIASMPQLMWFLGAGTSRTASMPTATDITWDLKRRYYCIQENQDIQKHDIHKDAIKRKIQSYMDSKGFPSLWSLEEYSFYFDLIFGENYLEQQKYINEQVDPRKLSLNIGHRVLAALLERGYAKLVFTTNFDEVIETAYSEIAGKILATFHLEGPYAALDALNAERFPIYAKIHGDFRYQNIKNLSKDLQHNDQEIQQCFLAASNRYGLVVSGYSGRDLNVMEMFRAALYQNNPFPQGLYWTVTKLSNVLDSVVDLITEAKKKNINAYIVETGTFDILLSKIWRQIPNRSDVIDRKVRTAISRNVSIPLPAHGTGYPILRTNALLITKCPDRCAQVDVKNIPDFAELKQMVANNRAQVVMTKTDKILAWGDRAEIVNVFNAKNVKSMHIYDIDNPIEQIRQSSLLKAFYEEALVLALGLNKPLLLNKYLNRYSFVIDHKNESDPIFQPLKIALGYNGQLGWIRGRVQGNSNAFWAESVSIKLEERNGDLWLLLGPDIWINPVSERQNCIDFLRARKRSRFNPKSYDILDAWISILLGSVGGGQKINVSCFAGTEFPIQFTINTRSGFSKKGVANDS